jgi:hypothetical protein
LCSGEKKRERERETLESLSLSLSLSHMVKEVRLLLAAASCTNLVVNTNLVQKNQFPEIPHG